MNPASRVAEECAAMLQLRALLIEEQANLRAADASACEALLPTKTALVAQLGDLAEQRYKQLDNVC